MHASVVGLFRNMYLCQAVARLLQLRVRGELAGSLALGAEERKHAGLHVLDAPHRERLLLAPRAAARATPVRRRLLLLAFARFLLPGFGAGGPCVGLAHSDPVHQAVTVEDMEHLQAGRQAGSHYYRTHCMMGGRASKQIAMKKNCECTNSDCYWCPSLLTPRLLRLAHSIFPDARLMRAATFLPGTIFW